MNDEHKLTGAYYQESEYEKHEGKIPNGHSSEVETIALPVASAHSQEPWTFYKNSCYHEIHGEGKEIATTCPSSCSGNMRLGEDNAQRIVDCVNACAGMVDPVAEIAAMRRMGGRT